MSVEVRLPQWGMAMTDAELTQWLKSEGDLVDEGEPIAEVEAAKVTSELVAPTSGVLSKILVPAGTVVGVGELLALVGQPEGGSPPGADPDIAASISGSTTDEDGPTFVPGSSSLSSEDDAISVRPSGSAPKAGRRQIAPRARRLAKERGVDLETVDGSGPGGRVVVADVECVMGPERSLQVESLAARPARLHSPQVREVDRDGTYLVTGVRRTIARRMHASLQSTAQLTLVTTADVTDLVAHRDGLAGDSRPTFTHFVVKAAAIALRRHPMLNASLDRDRLQFHSGVHIGVAADTDSGLIVPVVRDAERKSVDEIAAETRRLVAMVRGGVFSAEDITGSTFTVSSLGGLGIDAFTPIINPPEAAILGVGRILEQPTRDTERILAWRKWVTLSLTIDHRIVDGAPGASFLADVVGHLEDIDSLS